MLESAYGEHYIDVQAYIMGPQVWTDMAIVPTSADLVSQAAGEIPLSLAADSAHLTPAAYGGRR